MTVHYDRVIPYEGSEPYIFISYSHRDTDRVMPVIRVLQENGYRVWYDEGIDPGSEWPESIAQHLNGSTVCIFFISENSLQSNNCKREVNFALSKNKGFLSIALEPVEMTLGLELQIATYMSLIRYKYASENQFIHKLINVDILKPCREEKQEETVPEEPVQQEEPEKLPAPEPVKEKPVPAEEKPVPVKEKKVRKPKPVKQPSGKRSRRGVIVLAVAALAVLLTAIVLRMGGSGNNKPRAVMIGEQEVYDSSIVEIKGQNLTAQDMDKIISLEKPRTLQFYDCSFAGDILQKLSEMTELTQICLENCRGVTSLAFTEPMVKLQTVRVRWCGITDDILSTLGMHESYRELNLRGNELTVLPGLSGCPNLTTLNIRENKISFLDALSDCPKLKTLYAGKNNILDFSVLEPMIYLETVDIADNAVQSLDFLKNATLLKEVDFSGNSALTDLSILQKNAETLQTVTLEKLKGADLSVLASCTNIKYLDITGCGKTDLSFVSALSSLETLQAAGNSIQDLTPLSGCTALKLINLAYNNISSLEGLPKELSAKYWSLYLQHNHLENLDGLIVSEDCTVLAVQGNPLKNINALKTTKATYLVLDYTPDLAKELLSNSGYVYVTSYDLSQQVGLEKALGSRLHLLSEEEAMAEIDRKTAGTKPIFP